MKHFYYKFKNYLADRCNIEEPCKILVALSGGADSVALLHLLTRAGHKCVAMHCNFSLRGEESDGDEVFVRQLCRSLNVECHVIRFETRAVAQERKISIEMAARELRYNWFNQLSAQFGINLIATGHHGDDSIETFFLNLTRGTGLKGLTGISPRTGKLIRPLLFASSEDIKQYCAARNLAFRTDSTNSEVKYIRNKIRHQLIPLFSEINPSFFDTMQANMEYLSESCSLLESEAERMKSQIVAGAGNSLLIPKELLTGHQQKRSILFELLRDKGFSSTMVNNAIDALNGTPGRHFFSETHRLVIDRYNLILMPRKKNDESNYFIEGGETSIEKPLKLKINVFEKPESFVFSKNPNKVNFDAELIDFPLTIRHFKRGDKFQPLGMTRFKKLSDFFIDEKLSVVEKENTWLLLNGSEIMWIVGKRIDNRYKITASTKMILEIEQLF